MCMCVHGIGEKRNKDVIVTLATMLADVIYKMTQYFACVS